MDASGIDVEGLWVTYPNGHTALEDVSLSLASGRICGLVGMNGAGKSTLMKAVMGIVPPNKGRVAINGAPVKQALKAGLVAYVPQSEDVDWDFPVLVEDVVMMGRYGRMGFLRIPSPADRKAVDEALARVGLNEFRGRQIGELSGGQKKRVFVARALAQEARIILLDEPFTGVDVKTEMALIELLKSLSAEGRLILISNHDLAAIPAFCDDVILINRRLVACGRVAEVWNEGNLDAAFGGMVSQMRQVFAPREVADG